MSFLYLYKTDKKTNESLYLLQELLGFAKPKFLGMALTEDEFKKRYAAYIKSREFTEEIKKIDFLIATKKGSEIEKFKGKLCLITLRKFYNRRLA